MKVVVADSGPVIALAAIDALRLPKLLWGCLLVPRIVLQECVGPSGKPGPSRIRLAVADSWIEVVPGDTADEVVSAFGLDPGETQAITLARRLRAGLLLDEQRGRRAAAALAIPSIGTCGLLVQAKRAGLIPHVAPMLENLLASGYFLAPVLIADTRRLAGEA